MVFPKIISVANEDNTLIIITSRGDICVNFSDISMSLQKATFEDRIVFEYTEKYIYWPILKLKIGIDMILEYNFPSLMKEWCY